MSAYARVLCANELGFNKLRHAQKEQLWPIEVAFRSSNQLFTGQLSASLTFAHQRAADDEEYDEYDEDNEEEDENIVVIQLERSAAANALWTAYVSVPQGELMYTININTLNGYGHSGKTTSRTIAVGSIFVSPPEVLPAHSARNMHSGYLYRIVSHTRACAAVHFLFPPVGIADCGATFVEFRGDSIRLKSTDTTTNNNNVNNPLNISPIILVPYDTAFKFSFRVNLRNNTIHPRNAPLTHLGWDPSKSHSGALVTWENTICIQKPQRPFPLVPALLLAIVAVTIRKAFRQRLRNAQSSDVD